MELLITSQPSLDGEGTPESTWLSWRGFSEVPGWDPVPASSGRVIVVAPHPDDEILGAGGTVARLVRRGAEHVAVAVTDGEASHPMRAPELRRTRPIESNAAASRLGISPATAYRLGQPDGGVDAVLLARTLKDLIGPGDLVLAPWEGDGHPDHAQVALGTQAACSSRGATLLSYLVWAWHWAQPDQLPWRQARRVDLEPDLVRAKREAVQCFRTQLDGGDPILTPEMLARLTRCFEILLES
jgi:LmbE family N-acetylglucosaminyl deacetylase